jgi:hypothetical protein
MHRLVSISRDPFARCETVRARIVAAAECAWCGQPARFRYGTLEDSRLSGRADMQRQVFCSRSCQRDYTA